MDVYRKTLFELKKTESGPNYGEQLLRQINSFDPKQEITEEMFDNGKRDYDKSYFKEKDKSTIDRINKVFSKLSPPIVSLIMICLQIEPSKRWSAHRFTVFLTKYFYRHKFLNPTKKENNKINNKILN